MCLSVNSLKHHDVTLRNHRPKAAVCLNNTLHATLDDTSAPTQLLQQTAWWKKTLACIVFDDYLGTLQPLASYKCQG